MNWDAVEKEAVDLLAEYIRIDTTNPPGNETAAVEFLKGFLEKEGLEVQVLGKDPDRMNLICRISSGGDPKGLMLLHHSDVVGVNADEWSVSPFGGEIKDGYIWGRGALDMKGMGIMELMAFVTAHRERLPLERDVLLAVVCDEESGGQYGAEYLADNHPNEVAAAWCLNEGGSGWKLGDLKVVSCAFAEKGPLWVRLTAEGRSGHASLPQGDNPCEHIVSAANALLEMPRPTRVLPEMQVFLERFGMGGIPSDALEAQPMFKLPNVRAMFHDTMSLTMLNAGSRPNVIPDKAEATLDLRILPDRRNKEVVKELKAALPKDSVRLETVMSVDASSSPVDNDLFECVERMAQRFFPEVPFVHTICPGFTDSRCFRSLGTICCGWAPAMIEAEDLSRMHGKDERIKIADLGPGIQVMYEMIKELCGR